KPKARTAWRPSDASSASSHATSTPSSYNRQQAPPPERKTPFVARTLDIGSTSVRPANVPGAGIADGLCDGPVGDPALSEPQNHNDGARASGIGT
ncbi:MAG: hypothetical protein ACRDK2_12685, partial [Solirubrobacteraceae bacterium]